MNSSTDSLDFYFETIMLEVVEFINNIDKNEILNAAEVIQYAKENYGRVHITGIGKPSHVASYIAALNSSIGSPTYYLDATEAVHGSAGQVLPGDVIIAISNSGQTDELKRAIKALKKIGVKIIGVSGGKESWLSEQSDAFLFAGINQEGDNLNKPPRASIIAEIVALQSLSIILQEQENVDLDKYFLWHPGGALGESIKKERRTIV